jgi:hypothetical protein
VARPSGASEGIVMIVTVTMALSPLEIYGCSFTEENPHFMYIIPKIHNRTHKSVTSDRALLKY